MRQSWWAAVAVVVLVALMWLCRPASFPGSGELRPSAPAPGATLEQTPGSVEIDLGQDWSAGSPASVEVSGPDDTDLARGVPVATARGLSQRIAAPARPGAYQVSYRVRTDDGRLLDGSYWFVFAPHAVAAGRRLAGLVSAGALSLLVGLGLVHRRRVRRVAGRTPTEVRPSRTDPPAPLGPTAGTTPSNRVPRQRDRDDGDRVPPPTDTPRPARGSAVRGRAPAPPSGDPRPVGPAD